VVDLGSQSRSLSAFEPNDDGPHDDSAAVSKGEFVVMGHDATPLLDIIKNPSTRLQRL
jgi:hypothetical protein